MKDLEIIPAILEKDFKELQSKIKTAEPHFRRVQIDVGDDVFVSDKFGCLDKISEIKTRLGLEFHLMTDQPWQEAEKIKAFKVKKITFHYESFLNIPKKSRSFAINNLINKIKKSNTQVAIAINPKTDPSHLSNYLDKIDEVLLLSVTPGKQGQTFQEDVLKKATFLKNLKKDLVIGIDGGVNSRNLKKISKSEVDKVYVGSFLWKNFEKNVKILKEY